MVEQRVCDKIPSDLARSITLKAIRAMRNINQAKQSTTDLEPTKVLKNKTIRGLGGVKLAIDDIWNERSCLAHIRCTRC